MVACLRLSLSRYSYFNISDFWWTFECVIAAVIGQYVMRRGLMDQSFVMETCMTILFNLRHLTVRLDGSNVLVVMSKHKVNPCIIVSDFDNV